MEEDKSVIPSGERKLTREGFEGTSNILRGVQVMYVHAFVKPQTHVF